MKINDTENAVFDDKGTLHIDGALTHNPLVGGSSSPGPPKLLISKVGRNEREIY